MKKLFKLPLLLISLLVIYSCGRNAEADVEIMEDLVNRLNFLYDKEKNKENAEEVLEILLEAEEILSYYVNDASTVEAISFIRLLNEVESLDGYVEDAVDLKENFDNVKVEIEVIKKAIEKM